MSHLIFQLSVTILLIFSLPTNIATKTTDDSLVLDVDGNPIEVGSAYYVRTELSKAGIGGGLVTASKPNHTQCPQYVAQLAYGFEGEIPVTFYPSSSSQKFIHISSDINIIFNTTSNVCSQGAWQLTPDASNGNLYLSTGGVIGNPGSLTTANWFKIARSPYDPKFYQLEYCPDTKTVASATGDIVCGAIDALDSTDDFLLMWLGLKTIRPDFFHWLSFVKA